MFRSGLVSIASFFLITFMCQPLILAEDKKEEGGLKSGVKSAVSGVVSGTVSTGKDVLSGITEGIDDGRKSGDSLDGARIISNKDELNALLKLRSTKVEELEPGNFQVTLAIQNDNDFLVRVTRLNELGSVVLIDDEGFSYPLKEVTSQGGDVTALAKSATRARYVFRDVESPPKFLRFMDVDVTLPQAKAAAKQD
ncbi:hypothetical protein C4J81_11100 [Deltaproteobacteria bacterium Smac51]|nr:hypothetical protein C4J81_11100 [Deltaproteobacteria bacterium Smac51]